MRKRMLLAALLMACACASGGTTAVDDSAIRDQVRQYLQADGFTDVDVAVNHGVVTLTGHLSTNTFREKAVGDAERASGAKRVVDKIDVP